jgi:diketogulonate reductase-like aldo/keto reductase
MSSSLNLQSTVKLQNGYNMPQFGLGTWRSNPGQVANAVKVAIVHGYRAIDCAWIYDNEEEVGKGIRDALEEVNKEKPDTLKREDLFITSKVWVQYLHPDDVVECCTSSLKKLGLEYLDLLLIHWPVALKKLPGNKFSLNEDQTDRYYSGVDLKDTWAAMEKLVDQGVVKSIGVSNFQIHEIEYILSSARIKPVVNQVELHPYLNQQELRDYCTSKQIHVTAYSPLGNLQRDDKDKETTPLNDPVIAKLGEKYNKSPAQIILRWNMQGGWIVIPKSVTDSRIIENAQIFDFELSKEDMDAMYALGAKHIRFVNPLWKPGMKKQFDD